MKILELSKSSYYYTVKVLERDDEDKEIKERITSIYNENKGRYGYRRITLVLKRQGEAINHKRVKRMMKVLGLFGITPKAKYKSYKGDMNGTCKNLLLDKKVDEVNHRATYERNFKTTGCNQKWATDVSEFHISAGKLYLSPIIDIHNGEIVSFDISANPNYVQITNMLDQAFSRCDNLEGLIMHSDQGWQYQMQHYHKSLKDKGILQSMSRKGNCLDNSVIENFFGKMKNEMFYGREYEFESLEHLKKEMEEYITYYNEKRIKVKLKGLTPLQYRNQSLQLN